MKETLNSGLPLSQQISQNIEDMIVDGTLAPGDQIPSSTQMVKFYRVNHITVLKGVNMLADEGLIFKKRGVGMFVSDHAREILVNRRRKMLSEHYIAPLVREAEKLGISMHELIGMIKEEHHAN